MKILKTPLALLLCAALCLPMWSVAVAAESDPLPEVVADSGTDEPSEGNEIPLIPLVPATPSEAAGEEIPLIPLVPSTPAESIPLIPLVPATPIEPEPPAPQTKKEITGIFNISDYLPTIMLAVGDTEAWEREQKVLLEESYSYISGGTDDDDYALLSIESYDDGGLDINTPGDYILTFRLKIEDEYSDRFFISEETRTLHPLVSVCDPDKVTLRNLFPNQYYAKMAFFPAPTMTETSLGFTVWYTQVPRGEPMPMEGWQIPKDGLVLNYSDGFRITRAKLNPEHDYYFQVEVLGKFSNTLKLDPNTLEQDYLDNVEGDRDGGDTGGSGPGDGDTEQKPPAPDNKPEDGGDDGDNDTGSGNGNGGGDNNDNGTGGDQGNGETVTPPPVTPPTTPTPEPPTQTPPPTETEPPMETPPPAEDAPTPPAEEAKPTPTQPPTQTVEPNVPAMAKPTPQPEESDGFMELFGETRDLISGTRLLMMVDSTKQARFSKQGVTVSFSAEAVSGLDIKDSDHIAVTIEKESADSFSFSLLVNDEPVTALENTHVMVPYALQAPGAALSLLDTAEMEVAKGSYDATPAVASFTVNTTGRFSIVEEIIEEESVPAAPAPQAPGAPIWPAVGIVAILFLATIGGFLLKRRLRP